MLKESPVQCAAQGMNEVAEREREHEMEGEKLRGREMGGGSAG